MKTCSISGCGKKHKAKGLCDMHYRRNLKNGDPGQAGPLWQGREAHPRAKLTESDVAEIRETKDELTRRDAARRWGVHPSTIQAVIDNRNWGEA